MIYTVSLDGSVDFAPQSEAAEILQNIRTILNTCVGTVPLARDLGITWDFVDMPLPVVKARFQAAVIDAIAEQEPRANVQAVEFEENTDDAMDGKLTPRVIVSIGEEEDY